MGMSFNCSKSVKVSDLSCLLCNKVFHKKHVPNYHKSVCLKKKKIIPLSATYFQYADSSDMTVADNTLTR